MSCASKVQIAHVQDVSLSFKDVFKNLLQSNHLSDYLSGLSDLAWKEVDDLEYALYAFSDKVAPMTGSGVTGCLNTDSEWYGFKQDKCYEEMTSAATTTDYIKNAFERLSFTGGKDLPENQWDAVYRSVKAQTWNKEESAQRLVVLVTDDIAHFSGQDVADYRNLSFEYVNSEGILGHIADPKLHYNRRSLDGTWDYYTEYYGRQMWDNYLTAAEAPPGDIWKNDMFYFFECCTASSLERRKCLAENKDDCDEDDNSCTERFGNVSDCRDFGGRYATAYNLKDDVPDSFFEGRVTKPDIKPYDYKQKEPITEAECSVMEYPNPQSKEFAAPFIENDVMLVVFVVVADDRMYATRAGAPPTMQEAGDLRYYNHPALERAALACPNMDHDPWLTVACDLFGKATADDKDGNKCKEGGSRTCKSHNCEKQWVTGCLEKEYTRQLKGLNEKYKLKSALQVVNLDNGLDMFQNLLAIITGFVRAVCGEEGEDEILSFGLPVNRKTTTTISPKPSDIRTTVEPPTSTEEEESLVVPIVSGVAAGAVAALGLAVGVGYWRRPAVAQVLCEAETMCGTGDGDVEREFCAAVAEDHFV